LLLKNDSESSNSGIGKKNGKILKKSFFLQKKYFFAENTAKNARFLRFYT